MIQIAGTAVAARYVQESVTLAEPLLAAWTDTIRRGAGGDKEDKDSPSAAVQLPVSPGKRAARAKARDALERGRSADQFNTIARMLAMGGDDQRAIELANQAFSALTAKEAETSREQPLPMIRDAFLAARSGGAMRVFDVFGAVTHTLASLDHAETLWRVVEAASDVEDWWGS